jgi:hypothetical protein
MKKENCIGVLFELTAVEDGGNIFYLTWQCTVWVKKMFIEC